MTVDYLVVGSGLTGAVISRTLADAGREVMVVERRPHPGGNVHDYTHVSGIRVHTYGPHYFRTSSDTIWDFVTRFSSFYRYEAIVKSYVDGAYENWPVAREYLRRTVGDRWAPGFSGEPANFEEASLSLMPRTVYERFVKGYTEKQWGVSAKALSAGLAGRFDVSEDDDPRLKRHKHQGIPTEGYAAFMAAMLADVPLVLNFDYLKDRRAIRPRKKLIYTGPVDEFFGFEYGRLHYRGQIRNLEYAPDTDLALPCGQVNNPDPSNGQHIRTLEWKHMMPGDLAQRISGTVTSTETPYSPTDPECYEYPFPDARNANLYTKYRDRAAGDESLLVCGRLGEYRYYDMDQAIGRAMKLARDLLGD